MSHNFVHIFLYVIQKVTFCRKNLQIETKSAIFVPV